MIMISKTQREMIIRLSKQGKKQQAIAALVGCSQPTVSLWLRRENDGLSLETRPRSGRPTPLTEKTLAKLKSEFRKEAYAANKNYCSVNVKQFLHIIERETNRKYSPRHVERVLHKLEFSRITPRPKHLRHDQKKVDEFRDEFKKNFRRNMWVMRL